LKIPSLPFCPISYAKIKRAKSNDLTLATKQQHGKKSHSICSVLLPESFTGPRTGLHLRRPAMRQGLSRVPFIYGSCSAIAYCSANFTWTIFIQLLATKSNAFDYSEKLNVLSSLSFQSDQADFRRTVQPERQPMACTAADIADTLVVPVNAAHIGINKIKH
jgi:hypothetical protein